MVKGVHTCRDVLENICIPIRTYIVRYIVRIGSLAVQWSKAFTRRLDLLHMPRDALLSGMFREMERDPTHYLDYRPSFSLQHLRTLLKHNPFVSQAKRTPSCVDYSRARGCVFEERQGKLTGVWYRGHYLNTTRKQVHNAADDGSIS